MVGDERGTYRRLLNGLTTAERFIALLDEQLTLEAHGTDNLWKCDTYADFVDLMREAYASGVRTEIVESQLVGNRMLVGSRVSRPVSYDVPGPIAGQTLWRVFTLRGGRIVHIEDFETLVDATIELLIGEDAEYLRPSS
jgi:hypothetical protein